MSKNWPMPLYGDYQKRMRQSAAHYFALKGHKTSPKYSFILERRDDWRNNIILPEVADYIAKSKMDGQRTKSAFPLHRYIHHGLSSQAMVFNLIGPLVIRSDLAAMEAAFRAVGIEWPGGALVGEFEYDDRVVFGERQAQPTSLDFAASQVGHDPAILVESKLVEQEFGGCSVFRRGDCDGRNPAACFDYCYLHVAGRSYWDKLHKHGFMKGDLASSPICMLGNYYQYFRETIFALEKGSTLVFLVDDRNPVFSANSNGQTRGLIPFLERFLPKPARKSVKKVTVQEIIGAIEHTGRHADWIGEFRLKYGV